MPDNFSDLDLERSLKDHVSCKIAEQQKIIDPELAVIAAILFGSLSRGEVREGQDMDILFLVKDAEKDVNIDGVIKFYSDTGNAYRRITENTGFGISHIESYIVTEKYAISELHKLAYASGCKPNQVVELTIRHTSITAKDKIQNNIWLPAALSEGVQIYGIIPENIQNLCKITYPLTLEFEKKQLKKG